MRARKNNHRLIGIIVAILLVVLMVAIVATIVLQQINQSLQSNNTVITYSLETPSTEKPDDSFVWKGEAADPKKIIIEDLEIDNYIQNVGIDQNNQIAVPNNTHIVGWFVDSVRPGERGLSIMDGHIDLRPNSADAAFQNLNQITAGAEVRVIFGDDSEKRFRVIQVQDVSLEDAGGALFSSLPGVKNQLNLITCSGVYDESVETFSNRVIVSTELITS